VPAPGDPEAAAAAAPATAATRATATATAAAAERIIASLPLLSLPSLSVPFDSSASEISPRVEARFGKRKKKSARLF